MKYEEMGLYTLLNDVYYETDYSWEFGDFDTVGAIVGGIAEAFYREVPEHIKAEIHRRAFPDEYWDVIQRFGEKVGF